MRAIVGGVGYRNLRDHSVGTAAADALALRGLPDVVVEDLSYNPLAVGWRLDEEPEGRRFGRLVLVGGVARGRPPGTVAAYRWDRALPPADEIQRAVADAVTGVISLDNTLVVLAHFGALPPEAVIVEVEPLEHEWGEAFSPPVAAGFGALCALLASLATDAAAVARLPVAPLGGGARPTAPAEA